MRSAFLAVVIACADVPEQVPPSDAGSAKPKVGDLCFCPPPCGACDSSTVALFCDAFSFGGPYPCRGPYGCQQSGPYFACDFSGNGVGDRCPPHAVDGMACSSRDPQLALRCTDAGTWAMLSCPGGCSTDGGWVFCR